MCAIPVDESATEPLRPRAADPDPRHARYAGLVSDRQLREHERAALGGDVSAMVAAARLLIRTKRPAEALNWLDMAPGLPF